MAVCSLFGGRLVAGGGSGSSQTAPVCKPGLFKRAVLPGIRSVGRRLCSVFAGVEGASGVFVSWRHDTGGIYRIYMRLSLRAHIPAEVVGLFGKTLLCWGLFGSGNFHFLGNMRCTLHPGV